MQVHSPLSGWNMSSNLNEFSKQAEKAEFLAVGEAYKAIFW